MMTESQARERARETVHGYFGKWACIAPAHDVGCDRLTDFVAAALLAVQAEAVKEAAKVCDREVERHVARVAAFNAEHEARHGEFHTWAPEYFSSLWAAAQSGSVGAGNCASAIRALLPARTEK